MGPLLFLEIVFLCFRLNSSASPSSDHDGKHILDVWTGTSVYSSSKCVALTNINQPLTPVLVTQTLAGSKQRRQTSHSNIKFKHLNPYNGQ